MLSTEGEGGEFQRDDPEMENAVSAELSHCPWYNIMGRASVFDKTNPN